MANRIKELRNAKNWTLDDFSEVTGIKRGTLSNYENGNTEPKLVTWQKLADALGVPVPYLQGVSDEIYYTGDDLSHLIETTAVQILKSEASKHANSTYAKLLNDDDVRAQAITGIVNRYRGMSATRDTIKPVVEADLDNFLSNGDLFVTDGWKLATGHDTDEIHSEMDRQQLAGHTVENNDVATAFISAVESLDGRGETTSGILNQLSRAVDALGTQADKHFLDPKKLDKYRQEYDGVLFFPAGTSKADAVFDDLSPAAYTRAIEILIQARRDLQNAANDPKYRK